MRGSNDCIGVAPTQLTQFLASLWIDRRGGNSKSIKFVPVAPCLAMGAAMKGGHAGAILDVDPFTQKDVKQNGFVVLRPAGRGIVVDICINLTRARREAETREHPEYLRLRRVLHGLVSAG